MDAILYVEDNANDAFLLRRAFDRAGIRSPIYHMEDGEEAVNYLKGQGRYEDRQAYPFPDLVLLDLKLPLLDGFQVLQWIRYESTARSLRVFVLSSSDLDEDRKRAQALRADEYLVKTARLEDVVDLVKRVLGQSAP